MELLQKELFIKENNTLLIKDDEGKLLFGKELFINANGSEKLDGLRKIKDSHVYFGSNQIEFNNNIDILIDYPKDILFDIYFDLKINQFFFKQINNENNSYIYKKVEKLIIDEPKIFNLSAIIFSVQPIENEELKLTIYLENQKKRI